SLSTYLCCILYSFFFQAEDGIRDFHVTGVQTCALPIWPSPAAAASGSRGSCATRCTCGRTGEAPTFGCTPSLEYHQGCLARHPRSEERRVGKEGRSRWWPYQ